MQKSENCDYEDSECLSISDFSISGNDFVNSFNFNVEQSMKTKNLSWSVNIRFLPGKL